MEDFSLKPWRTLNNGGWTTWPLRIFSSLIYYGSVHLYHQIRLLEWLSFRMFVLLNWQEVWVWPLRPLNLLGKMRIGRERSSSRVFPVDNFPPTCSSVRGIAASLHTRCLLCCGGEKASISGWPNDKVFSLKIPALVINYSTVSNNGIGSLIS